MKTKLLSLLAGITLALPIAGAHAAGVRGFALTVLVDGSARTEYAGRDGTVYVEALRGRAYRLAITNPLPCRVAVALAVDGLNTIDGRRTDARGARKWVLDPFETVVISGWQVSGSEARRFYFTGERSSYGSLLGQSENLGVMEAAFFREEAPRRPVPVEARPRTKLGEGGREPAGEAPPPAAAGPLERQDSAQKSAPSLSDEYAATGIGRKERHDVTWVSMELEENPSAVVRIRYEFRPQLVKMGILPPACRPDPLRRRESAEGFEQAYCPDPFDR